MSRNDYDYFDLDNFDDGFDSRDYRRRQPQRRGGSYNKRSAYGRGRRANSKRTRNRIIIVSVAVLLVMMIIVMISVLFKACFGKTDTTSIPTETKASATQSAASNTNNNNNNQTDDLSPAYFVTPEIEDDNSEGQMAYNIYAWKKQGFELFGSDESKAATYAQTINGFADKLEGIKVYDMVIPNHTEMGLPQRLKDSSAPSTSQAENIKSIYSKLSDKVTPVNAYNYLAKHNKEYIYFGSDHHWTGLGAYYAYTAFAETNDLDVLSLEDCTENQIEGFTGTFMNTVSTLDQDTVHYWTLPYSVTMNITDQNGNVTSYDGPYYSGAAAGDYTYGVFILGDNTLTVLKSESDKAQPGKKIAVIKESYGNAMVPYLTNNYEEVHVIDFRYFTEDLPTYCLQNGIEEVLFINGVMSANTQIQLDSMSGLFKQ